MKRILTFVVGLFLAVGVTSCKKDVEEVLGFGQKSEITVLLKDTDGSPLSGWVVYGYNQFWWNNGSPSTSSVGVKQSVTDTSGKATFSLDNIKDGQEVYRFVVYYTLTKKNIFGDKISEESLRKFVAVNVKQGENQTITLQL